MSTRARTPREILAEVTDPEIPVLTIEDLGILRAVTVADDGRVDVTITPTYSGCPAMDAIRDDIASALRREGYRHVTVTTVTSPAWTTDWMSAEGRRKLEEYGIAAPVGTAPAGPVHLSLRTRPPGDDVRCPQCGSSGREVARFGSTACKAAYVCTECAEPFDYFKPL